MTHREETSKLISKLHQRLEQAARIAHAAEVCASEDCPLRTLRLLEDTEDLIRDATHLVNASLMMKYPDRDAPQDRTNHASS